MTDQLKDIDPALDLRKAFGKVTCGAGEHIQAMRKDAIFTEGAVSAKYKMLAATLWSISTRCEPCIKYYVRCARQHGVTEHELGEFLAVACTMGGCVGEMWALKAYEAFRDHASKDAPQGACCDDHPPLT